MTDSIYLAMTAAEILDADTLPKHFAYMACHFSPYGTGLSNLPESLPPDSILIVNDRTPICNHDAIKIREQLEEIVNALQCSGILLDFQRAGEEETAALCDCLVHALPCPVCVSHFYAAPFSCPVFVPPLPLGEKLPDYLTPWKGREIWMDIAEESVKFTVTPEGSNCVPCSPPHEEALVSKELHCGYQVQVFPNHAEFILHRCRDQLPELIKEAYTLGVTKCIGLYQELK